MCRRLLVLVLPLILFACSEASPFKPAPMKEDASAAGEFDWPQWRGPDRTHINKETGLLKDWPKDGPKLVWKADDMGNGYSTPSIAAGRVFLMGNRNKKEYVLAVGEKTGEKLWETEVGAVRAGGGGYPGPRCTPTVDGSVLYALGLNGDLLCINVNDGSVVWRKDLAKDFKGRVGGWGYSESPLVDGDKLIATPGGSEAPIVALNKKSGEVIWKSKIPGNDGAHYASAIATEIDGVRQYVQFMAGGVVAVAADTGKFLWRYDRPHNGTANCSTVIASDGHVFAASSYGTGGGLVKVSKSGDSFGAEEVFFTRKMKNHHGGMVLLDGHVYGSDEGLLTCLEFKTGEIKWQERIPGKGSIAFADGRLYYRNESGSGTVYLVEVNPAKFVLHGKFDQPNRSGANSWPHPVIANGRLYLRDQGVLLCYDVKSK
jgi:outer membrane protein assembly factor BamB